MPRKAKTAPKVEPEAVDEVPEGAELVLAAEVPPPDHAIPKPWDFHQTTRFSPEIVRGLRRLMEHWGPLLQATLPPTTRMTVDIGELTLETLSFEAYMRSVTDIDAVALVEETTVFQGPFLLRLEAPLALAILDRELGGPGGVSARTRPFSALELAVLRGPMESLTRMVEELLHAQMPDAVLTLTRMDTANQTQNLAPPTEAVLWVRQQLTLNGTAGSVHLVLPFGALEPALGWLVNGQRGEAAVAHDQAILRPYVGLRHARVRATLGPAVLTAAQVESLRPGDVVALGVRVGQGFWMSVEGRPAFLVHDIGRVGIRTGVRIAQQLPASFLEQLEASQEFNRGRELAP